MIEAIAQAIRDHHPVSLSEDEMMALARKVFQQLIASGWAWPSDAGESQA